MGLSKTIWANPSEIIRVRQPDHPVLVFAPAVLQATARRFIAGFPGLVTYAVKSNPDEMVVENLVAAGIRGFDVASPFEIDMIRRLAPGAALHYHNPVRARSEIAHAVKANVKTWSVDSHSELDKLIEMVPTEGCEISVRFKMPVNGAAYNFGAKFGATAELAAELLRKAADAGFIPSLTFHPGTQCTDPMAWDAYIRTAATICDEAGVKARRLNVGGGFPNHRTQGPAPVLEDIFALIDRVADEAFGADRPQLVCEPGRGLVGDAFTHITRIKALRDDTHVFLNDGVYGGLAELPLVGNIDRVAVFSPEGVKREGDTVDRIVFGPTCDSVDRLPGELALPGDLAEGDFLVFQGMGAYSSATNTRFNGFGQMEIVTALSLKI
ncbi:type III PLP-dependent enzyme [Paenirhodobacter populi]|uniref:ornithine decarboxylase n=1 Tax=Paenirhodobacter populi TaxID=2306993 RepID=A0A443JPW7_9RHOB|nr:type III PLP-dependent enzyme [Sinirhodobacter populi]RWR08718.1 type III PLP-dependent enzyme [Sinirhodobacter populi]RWR12749.1 type III PLP-dependent enzyme [Sinirhodobacter populi]RWR22562.1 type III PLP-dependent enzyme [Sinirhodobacter populi]